MTDAPTGGCLCGAVRYRLASLPGPAHTCHCTMCQKSGGTPFQVLSRIRASDLIWTDGQPVAKQTSAHAERLFCGACGSPLAFTFIGDEHLGLHVSGLDDPDAIELVSHDCTETMLPWVRFADALPLNRLEDSPDFAEAVARSTEAAKARQD